MGSWFSEMLKVTPLTTPVSVAGRNHFWAFGLDWVGPMKIGFISRLTTRSCKWWASILKTWLWWVIIGRQPEPRLAHSGKTIRIFLLTTERESNLECLMTKTKVRIGFYFLILVLCFFNNVVLVFELFWFTTSHVVTNRKGCEYHITIGNPMLIPSLPSSPYTTSPISNMSTCWSLFFQFYTCNDDSSKLSLVYLL